MFSVTSREESGSTSSSAWNSRMRTESAQAEAKPAASTSARQSKARCQKRPETWWKRCSRRNVRRQRMRAERMERDSGCRRGAEADARNFAFGRGGDFKELPLLEIAHARNHIGR